MKAIIFGFGRHAIAHHYALRKYGFNEIDAIDPNPFNPPNDVKFIDKENLGYKRYDVAIICTPPAYHCECMLSVAPYTDRILCEKPPATNSERLAMTLSYLREREKTVLWGFHRRFTKSWTQLKDAIKGNRKLNRGILLWLRREGIPPQMWQRQREGGGVILDLACHLLAQLPDIDPSLLNQTPSVQTIEQRYLPEGGIKHNVAILYFDSAAITVQVSWQTDEIDVNEKKGIFLEGESDDGEMFIFMENGFASIEIKTVTGKRKYNFVDDNESPYYYELRYLMSMPKGEIDPVGLWVQKILDLMNSTPVSSSTTHATVKQR